MKNVFKKLILFTAMFSTLQLSAVKAGFRFIDGKHYTIDIDSEQPISYLFEALSEKTGIPKDQIRLISGGKELSPGDEAKVSTIDRNLIDRMHIVLKKPVVKSASTDEGSNDSNDRKMRYVLLPFADFTIVDGTTTNHDIYTQASTKLGVDESRLAIRLNIIQSTFDTNDVDGRIGNNYNIFKNPYGPSYGIRGFDVFIDAFIAAASSQSTTTSSSKESATSGGASAAADDAVDSAPDIVHGESYYVRVNMSDFNKQLIELILSPSLTMTALYQAVSQKTGIPTKNLLLKLDNVDLPNDDSKIGTHNINHIMDAINKTAASAAADDDGSNDGGVSESKGDEIPELSAEVVIPIDPVYAYMLLNLKALGATLDPKQYNHDTQKTHRDFNNLVLVEYLLKNLFKVRYDVLLTLDRDQKIGILQTLLTYYRTNDTNAIQVLLTANRYI